MRQTLHAEASRVLPSSAFHMGGQLRRREAKPLAQVTQLLAGDVETPASKLQSHLLCPRDTLLPTQAPLVPTSWPPASLAGPARPPQALGFATRSEPNPTRQGSPLLGLPWASLPIWGSILGGTSPCACRNPPPSISTLLEPQAGPSLVERASESRRGRSGLRAGRLSRADAPQPHIHILTVHAPFH